MQSEYVVYTTIMDEETFLVNVEEVIKTLNANNVSDIEILFGIEWEEDWNPIDTTVNDIFLQIEKRAQLTGLSLYENDMFITIKDLDTKITFCHEADLHIEFNKANVVTTAIINNWKAKGLIHAIKQNKKIIGLDKLPYSNNNSRF